MAAGGVSLSSLTEEFQETRKRLKEVEEGIQKHTGRPSLQQRLKPRLDAPSGIRSQLANRLDDGPFRRHQGGAFSRLGRQLNANEARDMGPNHSHGFQKNLKRQREEAPVEREKPAKKDEPQDDEEDDEPPRKIGLQSLIGASSMTFKQKSRTELLNEQRSDTSGKERNKRMFGMILGTLKSFEKEETTKRKEQVDKKVEKEQKVDEMKQKEREEDIRQRRELLTEKREKIIQLKKLQSKMEVVGAFEEFSKRHRYMMNFIHTAAKPPIMWLPKTHTKETEKLLARSKAKIQIIIEKEEERMLLEVERIEGITRASDGEPDEKENSHLPSSVAVVVKHDPKESSADANGEHNEQPEEVEADADLKSIKIVIENNTKSAKELNREQKQDGSVNLPAKDVAERASKSPSNRSTHSNLDSQESEAAQCSAALPTPAASSAKEKGASSSPSKGRQTNKERRSSYSSSSSSSGSSCSSSDRSPEKSKPPAALKKASPSPKPKRASPTRKPFTPARRNSPPLRKPSVLPKRPPRISASPNRRSAAPSNSGGSRESSASPRRKSPAVVSSQRRSKSPQQRGRRPSPSPAAARRAKRSRSSSPRRRSGSPAQRAKRSPSPRRRSRSPRTLRRSRSPRRRR